MTTPPRTAVIINPISGTGGRPDAARRRAEQAAALLTALGVDAEIFVTERGGHARELATAVVDRGMPRVIAWGGDGTVNEVASALAFRAATMAVIPSGSGNGLARELSVPLEPAGAFATAVDGRTRVIDCGELDGRLFFNVAGLGLDAQRKAVLQFAANEARTHAHRVSRLANAEKGREDQYGLGSEKERECSFRAPAGPPEGQHDRHQAR